MYFVFGFALLIAAVDFLLKILVINNLKPVGTVSIISGLFSLKYVENKGAAFGMLANARWIFIVFTILIIIAIVFFIIKKRPQSKLFNIAAILIIGGGIGNLIDRIFYGYVVDYLSISFFPPVCNFADYCITIGAVLMVIYLLFFSDFIGNKKEMKNGKL